MRRILAVSSPPFLLLLLPAASGSRYAAPAPREAPPAQVRRRGSVKAAVGEERSLWPRLREIFCEFGVPALSFGAVCAAGFDALLRRSAGGGARPEVVNLDDLVTKLDKSGDGIVDRDEFMAAALASAEGQAADTGMREGLMTLYGGMFEVADLDGDGVLSSEEVRFGSYLGSLRDVDAYAGAGVQRVHEFGMRAALDGFLEADEDGNMRVDLLEFERIVRHAFASWGWLPHELRETHAREAWEVWFSTADVTGDEALDVREFQYAACLASDFAFGSMTTLCFRDIDANGDELLDRQEISAAASAGVPSRSTSLTNGNEGTFSQLLRDAFVEETNDHLQGLSPALVKKFWMMSLPGIGCELG